MTISLNQQIDEVKRELGVRSTVYPRRVNSGKMRQSIADYQIARMQAVLKTLEWLQANEHKIKMVIGEGT